MMNIHIWNSTILVSRIQKGIHCITLLLLVLAEMEKLQIQVKLVLLVLCDFFLPFLLSAFTPSDTYLIDCGSNETVRSIGQRLFVGDGSSHYDTRLQYAASHPNAAFVPLAAVKRTQIVVPAIGANSNGFLIFSTGAIIVKDPNIQNPLFSVRSLYATARIFTTPSSYKFTLKTQGIHVVRLHFYPFKSQDYDLSSAVFHVSVCQFQLLTDFRVQTKTEDPVVKEFFLKVDRNELVISFTPAHSRTFAFVNAIEVFSAPAGLLANSAPLVNSKGIENYKGLLGHVLETAQRINVGGPKITVDEDIPDNLWRSWITDEDYLLLRTSAKQVLSKGSLQYQEGVIPEIAPDAVYASAREMNRGNSSMTPTSNITWAFPVHPHSRHLVRLHFCDITSKDLNELYFNVYINDYSAYRDLNISAFTSRLRSPYYMDFVADSDEHGLIHVTVGPSEKSTPSRRNAILNGVEILKVISFAQKKSKKQHAVLAVSSVGAFLCILMVAILLKHKYRRSTKSKQKLMDESLSSDKNAGRRISFAEVQLATNDFDENMLIGRGGFGNVYKGVLKDGAKVAVKRGKRGCRQGLSEFLTEIKIFSKIRHRHLVSLIGYCDENSEMILVYEYMENGTLKSHLYGSDDLPGLSWNQRLNICIGSARGIHYLHTGPALGIIHRDIKSVNVLLDENYLAKVADFGISKLVPSLEQSHVSTNIKGSFGYFDPEYFRWQRLTNKSDVYSFGVVLLEVLCARPAIDHSLPSDQVNLGEWAMQWQKVGLLEQIIDRKLVGTIDANSLIIFGEIAEKCLAESGADRPTMGDVLWNLEYALALQNSTAMHEEPHQDSADNASENPKSPATPCDSSISTIIEREILATKSDSNSVTETGQAEYSEQNS